MYKILGIIAVIALFNGCGTDTSPNGSILNEINEKKISNQDDVAKIIKDYYTKTLRNVNNDNCSELSTKSSNAVDQSIVELSKKNCSNPTGLEAEINKVIAYINKNKSMNIQFKMINGYQDFIDAQYSEEFAKLFISKNISFKEAEQIVVLRSLTDSSLKLFLENDITDIKVIKEWLNARYKFRYLKSYIEVAKIKTIEELNKWHKIGIETPKKIAEWKKVGFTNPNDENLVLWSKYGVNAKTYLTWKELGYSSLKDSKLQKYFEAGLSTYDSKYIKEIEKLQIEPKDLSRWKKSGFSSTNMIEYVKNGITISQIEKWNIKSINYDVFNQYKKLNVPEDKIYSIHKIFYSPNAYRVEFAKLNMKIEFVIALFNETKMSSIGEYLKWKKIGLETSEEINTWKKGGNNFDIPQYAKNYTSYGFESPKQVKDFLTEANLASYDFKHVRTLFNSLKVDNRSVEDMKEWFKFINDKCGELSYSSIKQLSQGMLLNIKDVNNIFKGKNFKRYGKVSDSDIGKIKKWYGKKVDNNRTKLLVKLVGKGAKNTSDLYKMD